MKTRATSFLPLSLLLTWFQFVPFQAVRSTPLGLFTDLEAEIDASNEAHAGAIQATAVPNASSNAFRITAFPLRTGGGWRIGWSSVSGLTYQLQRWNSDDLSRPATPRWVEVKTVQAVQSETFADDSDAGTAAKRFYRVVLIESENQTTTFDLGSGLRLLARTNAAGQAQPILQGISTNGDRQTFRIEGRLLTPADLGAKAVEVGGQLVQRATSSGNSIASLLLTNLLPMNTWPLPGGIQLQNAGVSIQYAAGKVTAKLKGSIPVANSLVAMDGEIVASATDPEDLSIETDLLAAGINLGEKFYLKTGRLHVSVKSKPVAGRLTILDGTGGICPRPATLADGKIPDDPNLGPASFYFYLTGVKGGISFRQNDFDLSLTGGSLALPGEFSTMSAGECISVNPIPVSGGIPSIGIAPESALMIHYAAGASPGAGSAEFNGGLDISNFGFSIPGAGGQSGLAALKLCSARLLFNGAGLPSLTNLSGRLQVNDIGAFAVTEGSLNPDGAFAITANGQLTLNGNLNVSLTSLKASYDRTTFRFESTAALALPNGLKVEPLPNLPSVMLALNGAGKYELRLAGNLIWNGTRPIAVSGGISNQTLDLASTGAVHLGDGVWIQPHGTLPVMKLAANSSGLVAFDLSGDFLAPSATGGTQKIAVAGQLKLLVINGTLEIQSVSVSGLADADLVLPGSIRVTQAGVSLDYAANHFSAALSGQIQIANSTLTLTKAQFTFTDPANASNIQMDATLSVERLDLGGMAYFPAGSARLRVATELNGTRPPVGTIELAGSIGLFPKGPLPNVPARSNFQIFVENAGAKMDFSASGFVSALTNGNVLLPAIYAAASTLCLDKGPGPTVSLGSGAQFKLSYAGTMGLEVIGELNFGNIVVEAPGIPGLIAQLCSATLKLGADGLPRLEKVEGSLQLPLQDQSPRINLHNGIFSLDGYPSGRIELGSDLTVLNQGGFAFTLLGAGNSDCLNTRGLPFASGLTVYPATNLNFPPAFALDGGLTLTVPASWMTGAQGDQVKGTACGSLTIIPTANPLQPRIETALSTLSATGTFHIGGANGIVIDKGRLQAQNLQNLFNQTPATPFVLTVDGKVLVPAGPGFGLENCRFVFFDSHKLPKFEPGTLRYEKNEFALSDSLPLQVKTAALTFIDPTLELPQILSPGNLKIRVSAAVSIPPTDPLFSGQVDEMIVTFDGVGKPIFSVQGLGMAIEGLDIPPIDDLGGRVYIGGLDNPSKLFFAGRVGGSYDGYKLQVLLAFNLAGPIGVCVDFNAGAAGIPIDGGYLGGVLLSGASGGISFANSNGDPCEFTTYLDGQGHPKSSLASLPRSPMSWAQLRDYVQTKLSRDRALPSLPPLPAALLPGQVTASASPSPSGSANSPASIFGIPCPGDCPPPSVNVFCQPHPDQAAFPNSVIAKFSSIDEATLNRLGITESFLKSLIEAPTGRTAGVASLTSGFGPSPNTIQLLIRPLIDLIKAEVARRIREYVDTLIPKPDPQIPAAQAAQLLQTINDSLKALELGIQRVLDEKLSGLADQTVHGAYVAVRDTAYAGAPCPDITLKLTGTITHSVVSSFLSGTGGGGHQHRRVRRTPRQRQFAWDSGRRSTRFHFRHRCQRRSQPLSLRRSRNRGRSFGVGRPGRKPALR